MTHHNHEDLSMMDSVTTKYGKTTFVTLSKTLAVILVIIFFICLIATGLLVYSFTSTCKNETLLTEESDLRKANAQASIASQVVCDNTVKIGKTSTSTSTSTTPKTVRPVKNKDSKDEMIRLPSHVFPVHYNIQLHPFIQDNFTFHGKESIHINVSQSSKNITLHADELEILWANVFDSKQNKVSVRAVRMVKEKQFLIVELNQYLEEGQYRLDIGFKGVLNDMLAGFYRSSYVENNVTRWIAATQFQATEARKAFPCWDEPAFKAKFAINIIRLKNMTAISNMPLSNTIEQVDGFPDYSLDRFQESVPMSTYLVAFVVCDFKNIGRDIFNIWARPSALSQAAYALEIAPRILSFYEKFFGIKYPLPKVDMVAIPDFQAGAMENWGLITYREPVLLYEPGVSSTFSRRGIAHVVAHELAHQWFGNLVTPEWWDDLWLNEGFATYVEYLGANFINPQWKELDLFVVSDLHETLRLDALKSSHQISIKVNNPDEIDDIFDEISYCKGASVIRMMKEFLGNKTFHTGLNHYLKQHIYKNANQDDLWQSMTEQALALPNKATVKQIMDTWTLQVGFPLITAMKQENGDLLVTQEKYSLDNDKSDATWWVPVTIKDSLDKEEKFWMEQEKELIMAKALSPEVTWYYINVQQNGYYRVNYDEENWISLISQLQGNGHRLFPSRNRAQMIDDALQLAYAGYLSYDVALNVTLYLPNENDYVPWQAALSNFKFLYNMFVRSASFDKLKSYLLPLVSDLYAELTFYELANEEPLRALLRKEVVEFACKLGMKECVGQAVQQFTNWKNSANPDKENQINTDLRQVIYCAAIKDGGQDEWEFAWTRYLNANVASDKDTLLNALACSKEVWILARFLERSIGDSSIRKHDVARVFASIADNPIGHDLVYRFLKTNWQRIRDYLGPSSSAISELVSVTTENFNSEEEVSDFKSFFARKKSQFGIATRTAQQSIERGEANMRWMQNHFSIVTKWFESARVK